MPPGEPYAPCVSEQNESPPGQFGISVWWQPVLASHESAVHGSPSSQLCTKPPHTLPVHRSSSEQWSSSSHSVPSALGSVPHPVCGSQVGFRHWLSVVQTSGVPGWQNRRDESKVSIPSHLLLLLQSTSPFGQTHAGSPGSTGGLMQKSLTGSHKSLVHGSPSMQPGSGWSLQTPPMQTSAPLQNVSSGQGVPFGLSWKSQPLVGMQLSSVQSLWSLQTRCAPGTH